MTTSASDSATHPSELHFVVHVADHRHGAHLFQLRGAICGAGERDDFVSCVHEQRHEDAPIAPVPPAINMFIDASIPSDAV